MQENKEEIFKDVTVKEVEPSPRAHPLLYVLTVLVMVNLVITAWLAMRPSGRTVGGTKSLPSSLTKTERTRLFESFQSAYNAEDYNALYQIFDSVAQVQISRPVFDQQVGHLRNLFGRVENGVYSHHEYTGNEQGREWFLLHYVVKFEKASERKGYLIITIASAGREFGIFKFDLGYE
jgi:hypothetical protein